MISQFTVLFVKVHVYEVFQNISPTLREKCPNTEYFLVHIFPHSDQKILRIWTLFTQCLGLSLWNILKPWNFKHLIFFSSNCFNRNCFDRNGLLWKKGKIKRKIFFPCSFPEIFRIFKSEKVYVDEMRKCCNFPEKLCFIEVLQITCKIAT